MPKSRGRKNAGKGAGAMERKRRRSQRNRAVREQLRGAYPRDHELSNMLTLVGLDAVMGERMKPKAWQP